MASIISALVGGIGELNSWNTESNVPSLINGIHQHFAKPYSFLFSGFANLNHTQAISTNLEIKIYEFAKVGSIVFLYIINIFQFIIFSDSTEIFEATLLLIVMQILHGMDNHFKEINKSIQIQSTNLIGKEFYKTKHYGIIVQQVCKCSHN